MTVTVYSLQGLPAHLATPEKLSSNAPILYPSLHLF